MISIVDILRCADGWNLTCRTVGLVATFSLTLTAERYVLSVNYPAAVYLFISVCAASKGYSGLHTYEGKVPVGKSLCGPIRGWAAGGKRRRGEARCQRKRHTHRVATLD